MSRRLRGPGPGRGSGAAEDAHGDAEGLQCGEWRPIVQIERVLPDLAAPSSFLQSSFPLLRSKAWTESFSPINPVTNTLPSHTTGVEQARPSSLAFHMRVPEKLAGPFRSGTTPLLCGPLQAGQFSANTTCPPHKTKTIRVNRNIIGLLQSGLLLILNKNRSNECLITNSR